MNPHRFIATAIICIGAVFSSSCERQAYCPDADFEGTPIPKANGPLRIDGYYYMITDTTRAVDSQYNFLYTLYANGIYRHSGNTEYDRGYMRDSIYTDAPYQLANSLESLHWGIYRLGGNAIILRFRKQQPSECDERFDVREWRGTILSDTSFEIIREPNPNADIYDEGEFYRFYFRPFSPKLDSTNSFIK